MTSTTPREATLDEKGLEAAFAAFNASRGFGWQKIDAAIRAYLSHASVTHSDHHHPEGSDMTYQTTTVPSEKPTVVIFADASFDHETGLGGWGCWIKSDRTESVTLGGAFASKSATVQEAELKALACAIHVARAANAVVEGDHVLFQSDSADALAIIRYVVGAEDRPAKNGLRVGVWGSKKRANKRVLPDHLLGPARKLRDLTMSAGVVRVSVRHVKAHTGKRRGRAWVNRACDSLAKKGLRESRARNADR